VFQPIVVSLQTVEILSFWCFSLVCTVVLLIPTPDHRFTSSLATSSRKSIRQTPKFHVCGRFFVLAYVIRFAHGDVVHQHVVAFTSLGRTTSPSLPTRALNAVFVLAHHDCCLRAIRFFTAIRFVRILLRFSAAFSMRSSAVRCYVNG